MYHPVPMSDTVRHLLPDVQVIGVELDLATANSAALPDRAPGAAPPWWAPGARCSPCSASS